MPFLTVNNTRLFYRLEGREGLPVLVLSHSMGCDHGMWESQMLDLVQHFQVLSYDTRGHGASDVPPGDYTIEHLGRDALELADALGIRSFSFCGLSMGGAVGQWLAIHAAERLRNLVLANTAARFGTPDIWEARMAAVRQGGMKAIVDPVMQRFFAQEMFEQNDPQLHSIRSILLGTDPNGYLRCCAALRDLDHRPLLGKIKVPTLVIGGDRDPSTPWAENGELLAREIAGAKALVLPAAHLSNLARPHSFTTAVLEFVQPKSPYADPLTVGMGMRRDVLGDQHVNRSMTAANDFTRDFQSLITRYVWGTIWTRPGLDRRTRRLLTLATMSAMGRWEEFRLHVRSGLLRGLEPCDLKEMLLQVAVYAGAPAANTGFHIANEEMERQSNAKSENL
ncbi:MAG TPA: 3-oxoadipate enol-lactonase [Candidatus Angelobacter sp.]